MVGWSKGGVGGIFNGVDAALWGGAVVQRARKASR